MFPSSSSPTTTADGHPLQFRSNYLGHWLLINKLLPRMNRNSRIVSVSSSMHYLGSFSAADIEGAAAPHFLAYGTSKLFQIFHARELQERLSRAGSSVTINAVHPGYIASDVVSYLPRPLPSLFKLVWVGFFGWTTDDGARHPLRAGLDPALKGVGGEYFHKSARSPGSEASRDMHTARRVWGESERLAGARFDQARIDEAVREQK
jgi:retinol dehydrogenase 12